MCIDIRMVVDSVGERVSLARSGGRWHPIIHLCRRRRRRRAQRPCSLCGLTPKGSDQAE